MEVIVLKYSDWFFLCVSVKNFSCVWSNKLINLIHKADMSCTANERGIFPPMQTMILWSGNAYNNKFTFNKQMLLTSR